MYIEMEAAGLKCLRVVLVVVFVLGLGRWGEGCWEQEKLALLQLKPFFNAKIYSRSDIDSLYDWVEEEGKKNSDCCQWERVECDETTGRVIGLSLTYILESSFKPSGWYLNASLFIPFEELKNLSLRGNQIAGCLGREGFEKLALKLKKLEVLDLSYNSFNDSRILSSLLEISSLKSINLSYNQLRGTPTKLSGTVEIVDLRSNELDDDILVFLSDLSALKYLDLSYNLIKGSIHNNELKNLINLKELYLSGNEIKSLGSFHGLINLEVLDLTLDILNNSILASFGPFSKWLKHLRIGYGSLEGYVDIKDARYLMNLKSVAANNRVLHLLHQSLGLFPSLKTLHFEFNSYNIDENVTIQEWRNLTCSLEELNLQLEYSLLQTDILRIVGELTSLRVLSVDVLPSRSGGLPVQGVLQLKNLESLKMRGFSLQNNFLENIGAMTSLKILSLGDCGLNGTLSTRGICQLTHLQELDISENKLMGILPNCFSNLTFLNYLDLSSNQLYGNLLAISPLQSLTYIDLSDNQFQIPSSLKPFFNHSKLKYFFGNRNNIYAETELNFLAPRFQLHVINLYCCGDAGPLPKFLHHQHGLQSVTLSNINLIGEFPSWLLENNTELERLTLNNNSLSGHFQLPFHSPMKLSELDVSSNFIDGQIPEEIGVYLPGLTILKISNNNLDGSIPTSIGGMKSLENLDLSDNRLTGVIPENLATSCSSLELLVLSNNRLQGQIFPTNLNLTNMMELYLAGNNFTGSIPISLSNCSNLQKIDIGYNHLSGGIPRWMGNLSSLSEIIMPNNHIEGPIPMEFCQLDVGVLDLSMNNISGTMPSCFSPSLINHVHLSKNRLRGPIPNRICKSSRLVTLDLSHNQLTGNIPNCIGNLSDLSYLVLKHNNLEGDIPNQFCQLDKLSLIDLSHNNLSGHIPSCLNVTTYDEVESRDSTNEFFASPADKPTFMPPMSFETTGSINMTTKSISYSYKGRILKYLSGIDLSSNKLIGEIPHEMGNFHKIVMLNLSHNSLTGPIPPSLSNLTEIESLDLSYNNLSGSIPLQFVELYSLSYFNVSYNNLSGKPPPRIAQFASDFDENSYWGNPFLCGEPLPKNCSTTPKQLPTNARDDGGLIDIEAFCVTFLASYIMVLLCLATVLYINPHWRRAWLYFVERCITSCFYFVVDNFFARFCYCN